MESLETLTIRRDIRRLRTLYERAIQEDLPLEIIKPIIKELKTKLNDLDIALEKRARELAQREAAD